MRSSSQQKICTSLVCETVVKFNDRTALLFLSNFWQCESAATFLGPYLVSLYLCFLTLGCFFARTKKKKVWRNHPSVTAVRTLYSTSIFSDFFSPQLAFSSPFDDASILETGRQKAIYKSGHPDATCIFISAQLYPSVQLELECTICGSTFLLLKSHQTILQSQQLPENAYERGEISQLLYASE